MFVRVTRLLGALTPVAAFCSFLGPPLEATQLHLVSTSVSMGNASNASMTV